MKAKHAKQLTAKQQQIDDLKKTASALKELKTKALKDEKAVGGRRLKAVRSSKAAALATLKEKHQKQRTDYIKAQRDKYTKLFTAARAERTLKKENIAFLEFSVKELNNAIH